MRSSFAFTIQHGLFAAAIVGLSTTSVFAQLAVSSISPALNAGNVPRNASISVTFDRPVNTTTFTSTNFYVFGKITGPIAGPVTFSNSNRTVTLTPMRTFQPNEVVLVVMSHNLRGADNTLLRAAGYTSTFCTQAAPGQRVFREIASMSNRTGGPGGPQTRIYGGVACDLNGDGYSDITTINEVSADVRVFLNRADGTGLFQPMLTPHTPIPFESSPNEVADFDFDGNIDIVTSSYNEDRIAVCFGNGNGTFVNPPLLINVGSVPRGFGIIDADGDGDLDITVANAGSSNISYIRNDGGRTFAPAANFSLAGNSGEYGLAAADMNNDGILDLVAGCRDSQTAAIVLGNGNGTFTLSSSRSLGGDNWVLMLGDLDNDRNMDVSAANSFSNNGSILLGNGNGTLQAATIYTTGAHTVSTDLADIDGDGDLDWILSSFGGGAWFSYLNNGAGLFTPFETFPAPANPSCAIPMDFDNDGDIDLALTDEIADRIILMANVCPADINGQGGVTVQDIFDFLAAYFGNQPEGNFNGQGGITVQDVFDFLSAYFSACS